MKRIAAIVALLGSAALGQLPTTQPIPRDLTVVGTPTPAVSTVATFGNGRFQLLQADVAEQGPDGTVFTAKEVFKIDTLTGESWHFLATNKDGKLLEGWIPIEELVRK